MSPPVRRVKKVPLAARLMRSVEGIGSAIVDVVTARHQPIADRAMSLVERCEQEFEFDSGVARVVVLTGPRGGRYVPRVWWPIGGVIKVHPAPLGSKELKEFVFHEMGHAIAEGHELGPWLGDFCRVIHADREAYELASDAAANRPRRAGYVSGYASCNREEDFCETLAAYLSNRKSWRDTLRFNGELVAVSADTKLRRKLDAVRDLLQTLRDFR